LTHESLSVGDSLRIMEILCANNEKWIGKKHSKKQVSVSHVDQQTPTFMKTVTDDVSRLYPIVFLSKPRYKNNFTNWKDKL